jgi:hypothetical protein
MKGCDNAILINSLETVGELPIKARGSRERCYSLCYFAEAFLLSGLAFFTILEQIFEFNDVTSLASFRNQV